MAEIFDYGQFLENLSKDEWEELKEQYTNLDLSICLSVYLDHNFSRVYLSI
jgi:hypothetical protein